MPTLTRFQQFLAVLAARVVELMYIPTAIEVGAHVGRLLYTKKEASRRASLEVGKQMLRRAFSIEKAFGAGYFTIPLIVGISARGGNMLRFAGMSEGELLTLIDRLGRE